MAGIKISALPAVPSALSTDIFPVVQGGVTYRETLAQVQTLFGFSGGILDLAHGGTNSALVAANGAIPYMTATQFALLAPGTLGQLFRSGGAGAPTWTTATFPATAGASGNVLVSNGTNWSSSATTSITALGAQAQALNMNSHLINNVTDPVSPQDAATKNYVDTTINNGAAACVAASTLPLTVTYANGSSGIGATLTNAGAFAVFSIDGQSPTVGQRVLIKDQAATLQNGIYTVTTVGDAISVNWVLTRATDFDTPTDINNTGVIPVLNGTVNANTSWLINVTVTAVGVDPITFTQWVFSLLPLNRGGTFANLTASNGGIVWSNATQLQILAGTATAGQVLLSGASATPSWSTPTYPSSSGTAGKILRSDGTNNVYSTSTFSDTYTASNLLYSNGANTVTGLATAASSVLVTDAGGVPSLSTTLPAFTTSSITFNPTTGGIVGTTTNDNAAGGKVGEFISSTVATAAANTITLSNTAQDLTSISLTAGDWDVWGNIYFIPNTATTLTVVSSWISSTSATLPDLYSIISSNATVLETQGNQGFCVPQLRFSVAGATTVYLSVSAIFGAGNPKAAGAIFARRVR